MLVLLWNRKVWFSMLWVDLDVELLIIQSQLLHDDGLLLCIQEYWLSNELTNGLLLVTTFIPRMFSLLNFTRETVGAKNIDVVLDLVVLIGIIVRTEWIVYMFWNLLGLGYHLYWARLIESTS